MVAKGRQMTRLSLVGFPRTSATITSYRSVSIALASYSRLEMAVYIYFQCIGTCCQSWWAATGLEWRNEYLVLGLAAGPPR